VPNLVDELPALRARRHDGPRRVVVRAPRSCVPRRTDRIETTVEARARSRPHTAAPDGFVVRGVPTRLEGGRMHATATNRIAMLGAVAGVLSRSGVRVEDAESVAVSFPDFFELLDSVVER